MYLLNGAYIKFGTLGDLAFRNVPALLRFLKNINFHMTHHLGKPHYTDTITFQRILY